MVEVTTQDAPTDFESIQSNDEEEYGSDYSECNCGEIHTYYKLKEALKLPQAESKKLGGYEKLDGTCSSIWSELTFRIANKLFVCLTAPEKTQKKKELLSG